MSTFLQNWMNLRAMSAPRGGEEKMWERVQYLLPAGTSRNGIDLGISPTANMNVEMHLIDFDPWVEYGRGTGNLLTGNDSTSTTMFYLWAFNNGMNAYCRGGYGDTSNLENGFNWDSSDFGHEAILERRGASIYLNGVLKQTSNGTFTEDSSITLVVGDSTTMGNGTYAAKYAEVIVRTEYGGSIIGHFIPVKILKEGLIDQQGESIAVGVGCYYDLVTKQFYTATYGSDFIAGPAVPKEYIWFADPAVEAICVANWSSDGIGLTMQDAAAVTSLGDAFYNRTDITSFNEFQYFTGMGSLDYRAFYYCTNLEEITLPDAPSMIIVDGRFLSVNREIVVTLPRLNYWYELMLRSTACINYSEYLKLDIRVEGQRIESISIPMDVCKKGRSWGGVFNCWYYLKSVTIQNGETTIGPMCFAGCANLETISIPTTITSLGSSAFINAIKPEANVSISLPNLVGSIGTEAFSNSGFREILDLGQITGIGDRVFFVAYATTIVIPATVTSVGSDRVFYSYRNDCVIIAKPTVPPTTSSPLLFNTERATLYVPYSSDHSILAAYQSASGWSIIANKTYELNPDGTIPS